MEGVVAATSARFIAPARFDDVVSLETRVDRPDAIRVLLEPHLVAG